MKKQKQLLTPFLAIGLTAGTLFFQLYARGNFGSGGPGAPGATPPPTATPSLTAAPTGSPSTQLSLLDQLNSLSALNFLHHVNSLEIQEATRAQSLAQSQAAKSLVTALLTDHQQNEEKVVQLANQKGITLSAVQPATYEAARETFLASQSGADFDQVFMQIEKQDHQDVATRLQSMVGEVTDPDIRSLITQTIPVVREHIQLASSHGVPGATPTSQPSEAMD